MSDPQETQGAPSGPDEARPPPAEADAPAPDELPPLLPLGNPLRLLRGLVPAVFGTVIAFALMASRYQFKFGVPVGALAILVATFGILDILGTFDDDESRVAGRASLGRLAGPIAQFVGSLAVLFVFLRLAVDGRLQVARSPVLTAGILIPAAFLLTVIGVYRIGDRLDMWQKHPDGSPRPLLRRHGFWLVLTTTLIDLPVLGSHSLSDPWETHYGEVAREILARNDWISTWWAQDGWFWSKPVLDFWIQALSMSALGVRYQPEQMLTAAREGRVPWPEWAMRLPVFFLTLIAVYLLYKAVAKVFGRRAGLLGGIVLITMPQWFLVTHQTMTDMPFVAPMAAAMAMFLLAAHSDAEEEVRVYEIDVGVTVLRISVYHLIVGAIIACALPQILYLFSRNLEVGLTSFRAHSDAFASGSPGNCMLPGNEACRPAVPVVRGLQPALQALVWVQALGLVLYTSWGERRRQRLYFLAAWLFCAVSTMGKGPAGVLLPAVAALAYVAATKRWRDLLRMEIPVGLLVVLAVALPWFVAMYARHGQPFTDRLLFHDMFKRAFTHVHDTNEGDDVSFRFYVWQLGYATFPWTGLVPAGLVYWLRRRDEGDRRGDAAVFLAMWFIFAFSLFSLMLTKFHHYILPAVPPAAMLTGVLLDAMLRRRATTTDVNANVTEDVGAKPEILDVQLYAGGLGTGILLALVGVSRVITCSRDKGAPRNFLESMTAARLLLISGVAIVALTVTYFSRRGQAAILGGAIEGPTPPGRIESLRARFDRAQLGAVGVAGALLVYFVGRDLSANYDGLPNQIRLLHLFTYNYRRGWPTTLDFTPTLWAFTAAATTLTLLLFAAPIRRHVVGAMIALSLVFAAWGLDVYMMKASPHWGQRETMIAYQQAAREAPGPLIAYQQNWKGENFYMGNHIPAFVSSGNKFKDYIAEEKQKGTKTFYLMTEHGRVSSLQNELGSPRVFEKLTTIDLNNKFVLVRAVFD